MNLQVLKVLLSNLEIKRDIAHMEMRDSRMKADTLDYAVIELRLAIKETEDDAEHENANKKCDAGGRGYDV